MMSDKETVGVIFLFEFKMGCKVAETAHNITGAFGPSLTKVQCSGG